MAHVLSLLSKIFHSLPPSSSETPQPKQSGQRRLEFSGAALGFRMEPVEAEAVLETIWDLHDKVSDAIHALSRAHFLRTVRRRAGGKPAGVVHIKGVPADGDEAADLNAVAEEARSLHAIRAALEDLEDQFECFLVSLSNPSPYPSDPHSCSCGLIYTVFRASPSLYVGLNRMSKSLVWLVGCFCKL